MSTNRRGFIVGAISGLVLAVALWFMMSPREVAAQGPAGVIVLCQLCVLPGLPGALVGGGHMILMDPRSGDIWAYSPRAITGEGAPVYLGTLQEVGRPVVRTRGR